ncbi:hypothetical protein ABBQ32_012929 [Trebouxia sp. C0010 RCD-2024]
MDEQLHQPQHENETVDDAMDEHLRKYCQELVMARDLLEQEESRKISQTLELEQDQKERDKIQKEKYEVERKFQQQKEDLERKIREDKVEAEKKLTTIDARINKRRADCVYREMAIVQLRSRARTSGLNVRRHILSKERI